MLDLTGSRTHLDFNLPHEMNSYTAPIPATSMANRHVKLLKLIVKTLEENGPMCTPSILELVNSTTRHGTTMNELGNVLAKNKEIQEFGTTWTRSLMGGRYEVRVWTTAHDNPN